MEERRDHAFFVFVAADLRPAVVLAWFDQVDFIAAATLKSARTMLGGEQPAAAGLPGKPLGIPVTIGINIGIFERIVFGDGSVWIQPQDLTIQRIEILCIPG